MESLAETLKQIQQLDFSQYLIEMGIPAEDVPEMMMLFRCDHKKYLERLKEYDLKDVPTIGEDIPIIGDNIPQLEFFPD